jgi:hypothetical protein
MRRRAELTRPAQLREKTRVRTILKSATVQLALLAMLLRALLPAGWMPAASEAGASPLAICTLKGPAHLAPAGTDAHHGRTDRFCPFAAAAHLAGPTFAPPTPTPEAVAAVVREIQRPDIPASQAPRRSNEARAPPASA